MKDFFFAWGISEKLTDEDEDEELWLDDDDDELLDEFWTVVEFNKVLLDDDDCSKRSCQTWRYRGRAWEKREIETERERDKS